MKTAYRTSDYDMDIAHKSQIGISLAISAQFIV